MTTNPGSKTNEDKKVFTENLVAWWLHEITLAVTEGITSAVTASITVLVIILVVVGGLLLAYTYLPLNGFLIVLAVLFFDMVLSFALRAFFKHRSSVGNE